jgi:hypothetical protein
MKRHNDRPKVTTAGHGAVGVVGTEAITIVVPEMTRRPCTTHNTREMPHLTHMVHRLVDPCQPAGKPRAPLVVVSVDHVGVRTPRTVHDVFSNVA